MTVEEEGRAVALQRYKILAGLMGLLAGGLLIVGIIAVTKYPKIGGEPPYFIGCFIVGILGLINASVCAFIAIEGGDIANDDIKKGKIGTAVIGQYILAMFLLIGCFSGTIFAGIWGLSYFDKPTGYEDKVIILSGITIAGCLLTLCVNVIGMCIMCTSGSYFGDHIQNRRRDAAVLTFGTTGTGTNTALVTQTRGIHMVGGMGANTSIQILQEENRLLQENLRLQQELYNQQQRTQGIQFGFNAPPPMGEVYPPPDPSAPPPSYDSVK